MTTNHPFYYQGCSLLSAPLMIQIGFTDSEIFAECIEVIEARGLDFHLGNAIKYLYRLGEKCRYPYFPWVYHRSVEQDAKKALWYLKRYKSYTDYKSAGLDFLIDFLSQDNIYRRLKNFEYSYELKHL